MGVAPQPVKKASYELTSSQTPGTGTPILKVLQLQKRTKNNT